MSFHKQPHKDTVNPPGQIISPVNLEMPLSKAIEEYQRTPLGVPKDGSMTDQERLQEIEIERLRGRVRELEKQVLQHDMELAEILELATLQAGLMGDT